MVKHETLGNSASDRSSALGRLIRSGEVTLGGYKKNGIYGTLRCSAGRRMKLENRVFFRDEQEAIGLGYRPCGNCMPEQYKFWKAGKSWAGNAEKS
ncbi:Ada metal-binding domain-containing protein [Dyadobacter sp. LHD-138]|uniref:Ada metal-binding domain-containing protein n=1 Tax=Dyadobacter sp. LHD-138 TaxID=3071413 RepID=UPI0027E1976F|nr:Ada metal-binding domain-containing protein [Dyadobacter sp. LHD-138]MDQ6481793.1 Ada metal-binding domain-containing protein [Dyadobacter sp. LHD-138]